MARIVITDSDLGDVDIERAVFEGGGSHRQLGAVPDAGGRRRGRAPVRMRCSSSTCPSRPRSWTPCPTVRVLGRFGVSVDNFDLPAAAARGIRVVNVPDYCIDEVADHTLRAHPCAHSRHRVAGSRGPRRYLGGSGQRQLRRASGHAPGARRAGPHRVGGRRTRPCAASRGRRQRPRGPGDARRQDRARSMSSSRPATS